MEQAEQKAEKPKTLVQKLCEAGAAVGWIEKGGYNEFHKYKYATEADIVSALRGELFKRQVFIFPSFVRHERTPIEVETMKWDDHVKAKVPSVRKTALTEVDIEWTFTDGESGEQIKVMVPGIGEDSVDKGLYKAFTGSEKYLLMKSFLLPTGDDPERDSEEDARTAKQANAEAGKAVGAAKTSELKAKVKKGVSVPENGAKPALFYIWYDESQTAEVTGDRELMKAHWLALKPFWRGDMNAVVMKAQELEDMKYYFEQKGVLFKPLEPARA